MFTLAIPAFVASAASTFLSRPTSWKRTKSGNDFYSHTFRLGRQDSELLPELLPIKQPFWDSPGVQQDKSLVDRLSFDFGC